MATARSDSAPIDRRDNLGITAGGTHAPRLAALASTSRLFPEPLCRVRHGQEDRPHTHRPAHNARHFVIGQPVVHADSEPPQMPEQPIVIKCAPVPRLAARPSARLLDERRVTVPDSDIAQLGERLQPDRATDRASEGETFLACAWGADKVIGEGYTARPVRPPGDRGGEFERA